MRVEPELPTAGRTPHGWCESSSALAPRVGDASSAVDDVAGVRRRRHQVEVGLQFEDLVSEGVGNGLRDEACIGKVGPCGATGDAGSDAF